MACCLWKRISRMPLNSAIVCLLLAISILRDGVTLNRHGNRIQCLTNAFSLPQQQLAISKRQIHHTNIRPRQQQLQQKQKQQYKNRQRSTDTIRLSATIPFYATDVGSDQNKDTDETTSSSPPFLIESISSTPGSGDAIYKTIANLCIDVFFKELLDPTGKGNVNLVKAWQINYLKNLQAADLERRRNRCPDTNEMFVAYEVRKTRGTSEAFSQPLLMDDELKRAYNLKKSSSSTSKNTKNNIDKAIGIDDSSCYVRGKMLGFVEVTQRSYGLGNNVVETATSLFATEFEQRPILTNLAVLKESRKYGIGSKLLDRCEEHVTEEWKMKEIILEVEDYNGKGLEFYQKRGYEVLFSDPASRRYDIQGFWLNKVRCRRDIMRKGLEKTPNFMKSADSFFRKIRDNLRPDHAY